MQQAAVEGLFDATEAIAARAALRKGGERPGGRRARAQVAVFARGRRLTIVILVSSGGFDSSGGYRSSLTPRHSIRDSRARRVCRRLVLCSSGLAMDIGA